MKTPDLGAVVTQQLQEMRAASPALNSVMGTLSAEGNVVVMGGAPRDWFLGKKPRDLDIVVDAADSLLERTLAPHCLGRTRYGGYKLAIDGVAVDVWSVKSTWAFSVRRTLNASVENLPLTAFYNVDAVAVSANDGRVFEHGFTAGFRDAVLCTVFEENPFPALCAVRGLVLARRYNLRLGKAVVDYFERLVDLGARWEDLDAAQVEHYGERKIRQEHARALLPTETCSALFGRKA